MRRAPSTLATDPRDLAIERGDDDPDFGPPSRWPSWTDHVRYSARPDRAPDYPAGCRLEPSATARSARP